MPSTSNSRWPSPDAVHLADDGLGADGIEIVLGGRFDVGSRCVNTTISLDSVASAASTAAIDAGRPADRGITGTGNSTAFFSGSTGSV